MITGNCTNHMFGKTIEMDSVTLVPLVGGGTRIDAHSISLDFDADSWNELMARGLRRVSDDIRNDAWHARFDGIDNDSADSGNVAGAA